MFAAISPEVMVAIIGLPATIGTVVTGIWAIKISRRNNIESTNIAHDTLDLSVMQAQISSFKELGELQAKAIDQRDREIVRQAEYIKELETKVNK